MIAKIDKTIKFMYNVIADKYHEFNSSQHTVYPKTGWLILFPANLLHVVLPSKEERHSIVYDIGVKLI